LEFLKKSAPEVQSAPEVMTSSEAVHQKHLIRSKITRSCNSSGVEELKDSKAGISFNHA